MPRQAVEELTDRSILFIDQKCMIPNVYQMLLGERLDVGKIHDHPVIGTAFLIDHGPY